MHATVTWLGEGEGSPPSTAMGGITFPLGQPVLVEDEYVIAKTSRNRFFMVAGPFQAVADAIVPPPEPLPEMPPAPPLTEQLKVARKRGPRGTYLPKEETHGDDQ